MHSRARILITTFAALAALTTCAFGQANSAFRVGEKLSYTLSFGNFKDGGYAEMYVASTGKMSGHDVVEIRSRLKTIGAVSSSFLLVDEVRTVYADPTTGVPLYIRKVENTGAIPRQTKTDLLKDPPANFDIVTLLYRMRAAGGVGTLSFFDGEHIFDASFQASGKQHIRTDAGDFDTIKISVQSEYLASRGVKDMKIFISADDDHIPVFMRFRAQSGDFEAALAAVTMEEPTGPTLNPTATPTPVPQIAPVAIATPRPTPVPRPYVENAPLLEELGFQLGEKLNYRVSQNDQPLGTIVLEAVERKKFERKDSLLLTATVTGVDKPNSILRPGDHIQAQVDPESLAPRWVEGKFGPTLEALNQTVTFDPSSGATVNGTKSVDVPIRTHTLLSLIYAMRSFNLQHSRDDHNPINDTRVAVFFQDRPYVFTLRPLPPAEITINGVKVSAQEITVSTQNQLLDSLGIKIWLDADSRVPVRIAVGAFKADLITEL